MYIYLTCYYNYARIIRQQQPDAREAYYGFVVDVTVMFLQEAIC